MALFLHWARVVIGWILTFSPIRANLAPVIGDFTKVQPSKQRARGRIGSTVVKIDDGQIAFVRTVSVKRQGRLRSTQLYRLTLNSEHQSKFHVFFSVNDSSELRNQRWKRAPMTPTSYSGGLPTGVTSVQHVAASGTASQVFTDGFSINLAFSQVSPGQLRGSILLVFPDKSLSFVNGAFRANLL